MVEMNSHIHHQQQQRQQQRQQHNFSFTCPPISTSNPTYTYTQDATASYYPQSQVPVNQLPYQSPPTIDASARQSSGGSIILSDVSSPQGSADMYFASPSPQYDMGSPPDQPYSATAPTYQYTNGHTQNQVAPPPPPPQSQYAQPTHRYEAKPYQNHNPNPQAPVFPPIPNLYHPPTSTLNGVAAGDSNVVGHRLKRSKPTQDEEEEEEEGDGSKQTQARLPGACGRCKQLKVKCDFPVNAEACKKCMQSGNECIIPGRKKRKPPAKRDELIKQIRDKDSLITQLLEQLEARSSVLAPLSLHDGSPNSSAIALKKDDNSAPPDSAAQAAILATEEKREKELAEWIKKAKATILETRETVNTGLLGGDANPYLDKNAADDDDDDDYADEDSDGDYKDDRVGDDAKIGRNRTASPASHSRSGSGSGTQTRASALSSTAPLGFLEHMGKPLSKRRSSSSGAEGDEFGMANPQYFTQSVKRSLSTDPDNLQLPQILTRSIVTPNEVRELFTTYFECMNLSTCLLDERLYNPEYTLMHSPFLFTVICAIASRYHPARKDLYPILMNQARLDAGTALISGRKSLEACQAYILMAIYPIPARRWSEDRSWLFLGCAIRMATDLNLHHPPVLSTGRTATTIDTIMDKEAQARDILNRTRAWLSCFNIDKATSTQFGKPTTLREDWMFPLLQRNMAEGGAEWWCPSPFAAKFDIHLCAYSALLREIAAFHEQIYSDPTNPTGLNENIAFEKTTYEFDDKIEDLGEQWFLRVDTHMDKEDPQCVFRKDLLKLEFYYNQLVALSFGFQHAFRRGAAQKDNQFLMRCYKAASRVVRIVVEQLAPQKYMRYCPEAHFIFATFASAFLLKLLRPKFSAGLDGHHQHEILDLVDKLVKVLGEIAVDDRHAPKLYSRFLSGLLKKTHKILARGTSSVSSPASSMNDPQPSASQTSNGSFSQDSNTVTYAPPTQPAYNMDGIEKALPQHVWPYGVSNPGDADTLASMHLFGDQFWEDGLLPGFSWAGSGPTPAGENMVGDPTILEEEMQGTYSQFSAPSFSQTSWTANVRS